MPTDSSKTSARFLTLILAAALAAAEAPPVHAQATPTALTYALRPGLGANTVVFTWKGDPGASYSVEITPTARPSDVMLSITTGPSFVWDNAPTDGAFQVQVREIGTDAVSEPSDAVRVESVDVRDVIEALFLGSGPLLPSDGFAACVRRGRWIAFREGVTVRVRLSTNVPRAAQDAVQVAAEQLVEATGGRHTAVVEMTGESVLEANEGEVVIFRHPDPLRLGCTYPQGCTFVRVRNGGEIVSARAVIGIDETAAYPHDVIGHGALGMCHIDGAAIGGARQTLMGGGPRVYSCYGTSNSCIALSLTPLDVAAARLVYSSGLSLGAGRSELVEAGLVRPNAVSADRAPAELRRVPLSDTDELVVVEHP